MSLTDIQVQEAKPRKKQYKLADGKSMYLIVTPKGGKYWRLDYRFNGKRQTLSLGTFPSTSLKDARRKRENTKSLIKDGVDPSHRRKIMLTSNRDSFEAVATGQSTRDPTTYPKSVIHEYKPSEKAMGEKWRSIMAPGTSAIIIAAGLGSRMQTLTDDKPKCMLEFGEKTLLQRQLDAYWACGVTDISVVRGYQKDKIHYDGLRYFENPDYKNNNILNSLFYAEEAITGHVICAYSDILFDAHVVQRVLEAQHDISVVVDIDWRGYYDGRRDHPLDEAENIIFDANNRVIAAGKAIATKNDVHGEFIGMMKFSPHGAEIFKRHFNRIKELYAGKPFQRAKVFEKSYLTDIIQDMTDIGIPIHCVIIERGWKEIDTIEDYEKALMDFDN
jgi:L-glutamine-phosphate cytidylyltransferase